MLKGFKFNPVFESIKSYKLDDILEELLLVFPTDTEIDREYFELINNSDNSDCRIMIVEGKIVGFLHTDLYSDSIHINMVAVNPDYKGKGYSKDLMNLLLDKSLIKELYEDNADNINCVTLEVNNNNTVALSLYIKTGFKITGFIQDYYKDGSAVYMKYSF